MLYLRCSVLLLAIGVIQVISIPLGGMMYYQAPYMYRMPYQHAMYVQYTQPHGRGASIDESGVSAYATGDTIATGTYLKNSQFAGHNKPDNRVQQESTNKDVVAIAEAYPADEDSVTQYSDDVPLIESELTNEEPQRNIPVNDFETPANPIQDAEDGTTTELEESVPTVLTTSSKRKVRVQLDEDNENGAYLPPSEQNERDLYVPRKPVYAPSNQGYPSQGNNQPQRPPPQPQHPPQQNPGSNGPGANYFPVYFGSAGGPIAIANAYSTSGAARSHAIAYGTPAKKILRKKYLPEN